MTDIRTMNLGDAGDGMVPIDTKPKLEQPSVSFVDENIIEKNVSQQQETTMDSTPIADLMAPQPGAAPNFMAPPAPTAEGRSQGVLPSMSAPQTDAGFAQETEEAREKKTKKSSNKNPFGMTDDQMFAVVAGVCAAVAVSKPVQEKLVSSVPKFLSENGSRSAIGLASTGLVAAIVFWVIKTYVIKH